MPKLVLPFPFSRSPDGRLVARYDHIWEAAKAYARERGMEYNGSGVQGVAPL